ncbi:hypothetical protein D1007_36566 [Hordeum vulgare]|nr:hypothetical protein D1007_36566 [Hordeum vulgare]
MEKKMQKLRSLVAEHKANLEKVRREQVEMNEFKRRVESYARTIDGMICGAAKVAFICALPFAVFADNPNKGVDEAQAVTKGNPVKTKIES